MEKIKLIQFLVLITVLPCCDNDNPRLFPDSESFTNDNLKHIHLLDGQHLELEPITNIYRYEIIDSLLICSGTSVDNYCKMHIYSLNTNKRIVSFADEGRGPGEFIRVDAFYISRKKREIYIIDNSQQLMITYSIDSIIRNQRATPSHKALFRESTFTPEYMIDTCTFLCEMAIPYKSPYVLNKVRYPSFEKLSIAGYPPLNNFDSINLARHYQGVFGRNVSYNDEAKRIVVAYAATDLIEIYDEDLNRLVRIHGPDHFFPEYQVEGTPRTYDHISYNGKSIKDIGVMGLMVNPIKGVARYGYLFVTTTSKGVYAVYSGDLVAESNTSPPEMKTVYFFDYKGKAKRKFTFESGDIHVIKVDQNDEKLYTLYMGNLVVYKMK